MDEKEMLIQLKLARQKCDELKSQSVEADRELDRIETQIVDYLEAKQASSSAKYDGIGYVTIEKPKLHASVNKEDRPKLIEYLKNLGKSDLVIETIPNKSLNEFVKECLTEGFELPDYINHYFERVVKLYQ